MRAAVIALAGLALLPATAAGHATLEDTTPERGAALDSAPARVELRFSEGVDAGLGAVRVFDSGGREVQEGEAFHPGGRGNRLAVRLPDDLPEGGFTTTYRVVSADSHPISGGFSFSVGTGGGGAQSVDRLLAGTKAGPVTSTALATARAIQYAAIALAVGVLAFLLLCWPAAAAPPEARAAFAARTKRLLRIAAAAGAVSAVAALFLQGAQASGETVWGAADTVGEVLGTRFGMTFGLAVVAWIAVAVLASRPLAAAPPVAALCLVPAFGGHASVQEPVWVNLPANYVHVVAIGTWVGGIAVLVLALRGATTALEPAERTRMLAAVVGRFSTLAGIAVAVVLATGIAQSLTAIDSPGDLLDTAYGRAVAIKLVLFGVLVVLGYVIRSRPLPALRRAALQDATPGRAGQLLRRTLTAELAVAVVVLGVTGALASYPPADSAAAGPVSESATIGPARMEATVDPALAGVNEMHLYFFERRTGAQWTAPKEVRATASLPDEGVDDLEIVLRRAGPGHYVAPRAEFGLTGDWEVTVTARVSDFDEYAATIDVPIE